ncbi:extracellular solute-binding protein [Clostridiaceae bacterium]|nr:extracellular solute-binding protein [Clostridiaceae bacterium]RKI11415.1 extracellular solute-binding protein [bacterium 1XD21-70]
MKKRISRWFAAMVCIAVLAGCQGSRGKQEKEPSQEGNPEKVELVVWGAQEDEELLRQIIGNFEKQHQGEADFQITFEVQGETKCKDVLLENLEEGADVFTFADDQLNALAAAGALEPLAEDAKIRSENLEAAVEAASVNNILYAYPLTADNGYFMYYNKKYFTEQDIKTLDRMLEIAQENDKRITMDWSSAWYVYSFFGNTGMEVGLNTDGITNFCTWNQKEGKIRGVDVAEAMGRIAKNPGFASRTDTEFMAGVQDGTVIAGISGVWNAVAIEEAWGRDFGAAKLPIYTCRGEQVQMASFSGCKLVGVNAYSRHYAWASKLAEWIANEENQKLRFQLRGQGPSNIRASQSPAVQEAPAIAALLEQSEYAQLQRVGGKFWDPVTEFAGIIAAGNPDHKNLQELLDKLVEEVTAR